MDKRDSYSILVLYWHGGGEPMRPAIRHHLRAWEQSAAGHGITYHNVARGIWPGLAGGQFSVIVLHTTLLCMRWWTNFPLLKERLSWLKECPSVKIAMPQDEYDHAETLDDWLTELGVDIVATNFGPDVRPQLYPRLHQRARFVHAFTGYIDEDTARALAPRLQPAADRPLDVVYRANHLPYWFGSQGQLKHRIADVVLRRCQDLGLRCDISTEARDTIVTDGWFDFLAGAKAIIGCESGSSALDRRGEIQAAVRSLLQRHPDLSFEEVSRRLPQGWDDHRFFAIGPRHLEAVLTRTCQILVEGHYDGVLQAGRHYLSLRRDLANLDETLAALKDHALVDRLTEQAYEDILVGGRYGYRTLARRLDEALAGQRVPPPRPWSAWWAERRLHLTRCGHALERGWSKAMALAKDFVRRRLLRRAG